MKKLFRYICIIVLILYSFAYSVYAENDIENNINNTENIIDTEEIVGQQINLKDINTQIEEANIELIEIREKMTEVMIEIQELTTKISEYELEKIELENQIALLEKDIIVAEIQIDDAETTYIKQEIALKNRIITMYQVGETRYLDVLLSSKNIVDFISNCYLITEITKYDNEMLKTIDEQKNSILEVKQKLDKKQESLKELKKEKEKTTIALKNVQIIKNRYLNQLSLEELAIQTKLDLYEKAFLDIEYEIKKITLTNRNTNYVGGSLAWPIPGYTNITSPYGMRIHPITGVYKLHTGMDVGAPTGSNFIAVNDGVVIKVGYNRAYGNMVIIDHGGGVSSLYAHGSEIMVNLGDTIKKGTTVLKIGSTGYSTGPHAHFEIRINGHYVDPLNYILSN